MNRTNECARILLMGMLILGSISCARGTASQAPSKTAPPQRAATGSSDAATDEALKALPEKGETEAKKQAEQLEADQESERALQEQRKREREEEAQRLQRAITEDRIRTE